MIAAHNDKCISLLGIGPQTIAVDCGGGTDVSSITVPVGASSFNLNAYSLNGNDDKITGIDTPTYSYGVGDAGGRIKPDRTHDVFIDGAGKRGRLYKRGSGFRQRHLFDFAG